MRTGVVPVWQTSQNEQTMPITDNANVLVQKGNNCVYMREYILGEELGRDGPGFVVP